jgi:hypothetical protein
VTSEIVGTERPRLPAVARRRTIATASWGAGGTPLVSSSSSDTDRRRGTNRGGANLRAVPRHQNHAFCFGNLSGWRRWASQTVESTSKKFLQIRR